MAYELAGHTEGICSKSPDGTRKLKPRDMKLFPEGTDSKLSALGSETDVLATAGALFLTPDPTP